MNQPIRLRIYCTGVGGQGTLLATRLLGEAAMAAGYQVQVAETHGMAQRGGVVESTVVLGGWSSPIISLGEADILLGFEALESFRSLNRCHDRTLVIANVGVNIPYTVAVGLAQYPPVERMMDLIRRQVGRLVALDANALARQAGHIQAVNMVILGALMRTGILPFSPQDLQQVIRDQTPSRFLDINLKAFDLGYEAAPVDAGPIS